MNCLTCDFNTQILIKPQSCEGVFIFTPDLYALPNDGPSGPNYAICPMYTTVYKNCRGDYKVSLLDDNSCVLDEIVLKCAQFDVRPINSVIGVDQSGIRDLFINGSIDASFSNILTINANNLNVMGQYVALEEAAYFYRRVTQTYLNLWCGGERSGIICQMLGNVKGVVQTLSENAPTFCSVEAIQSKQIYALGQDLIKARIVALKQLCECGKVCNDQFFACPTNPCQPLADCYCD